LPRTRPLDAAIWRPKQATLPGVNCCHPCPIRVCFFRPTPLETQLRKFPFRNSTCSVHMWDPYCNMNRCMSPFAIPFYGTLEHPRIADIDPSEFTTSIIQPMPTHSVGAPLLVESYINSDDRCHHSFHLAAMLHTDVWRLESYCSYLN
jgi:hypothetical protein